MSVVALYIDPRGPYPTLLGAAKCWDAARDARLYAGPDPIVAHPPCGPWGRLRHMAHRQAAQRPLALVAVQQVRVFGGVLEHPALSKLWDAFKLPRPGDPPDAWGGYTVEVCQSDFGHVARKRTWLYLVGVPRSALEHPPRWEPTHWISGTRAPNGGRRGCVPAGIKVCSAEQRRRTPRPFAEYLIRLAEASRGAR